MSRDTIGKIAVNLSTSQNSDDSVIDVERALHRDYEKQIELAIQEGKKNLNASFFYIVVITKKEPLLTNVYRNYFFSRNSCPTPDYDQTVYYYDKATDSLQFLWVVPSKDSCIYLKENALEVAPEERELLQFVLDFSDGSLFRLAKKLNGEKEDSIAVES
jgi:hypothetical protein